MSVFGLGDLAFLGAASGSAYDADAQAYITAVEAVDGQALETAVRDAIDAFVRGCKTDGILSAIKASCILAGARTLAGALVPLVGTAPTNVGPFVSADYNRKTGLVGDASTKVLLTGRNANASPVSSNHIAVFVTELPSFNFQTIIGSSGAYRIQRGNSSYNATNHTSATTTIPSAIGLFGASRNSTSSYVARSNLTNRSGGAVTSEDASEIAIFGLPSVIRTNARLAFYSIGEALDLALLDARVTALINAFAAAIP